MGSSSIRRCCARGLHQAKLIDCKIGEPKCSQRFCLTQQYLDLKILVESIDLPCVVRGLCSASALCICFSSLSLILFVFFGPYCRSGVFFDQSCLLMGFYLCMYGNFNRGIHGNAGNGEIGRPVS